MAQANPSIPGSPEPSVASEGLPAEMAMNRNRVTPDNMGLGNVAGQGLEDAGKLAGQAAQMQAKAENDADNSVAAKAVSAYGNATLDAFYGDGTKNADGTPTGFNSVLGQDATKTSQKVLDDNTTLRAKIRDGDGSQQYPGLANQAQKDRFDALAQSHTERLFGLVHGHAARQADAANEANEKALIDTSLRTVATTAADQTQSIDQITAAITDGIHQAALPDIRMGSTDAVFADNRNKYIANAAETAIKGALSSNSDNDQTSAVAASRAQAILDKYGAQMDPVTVKRYGDAIKNLSTNVNASQMANKLIDGAKISEDGDGGYTRGPLNAKKLYDSIDAMPEGSLKDATFKLVTERAVAQSKAQDAMADGLRKQFEALGTGDDNRFHMPTGPAAAALREQLKALDPDAITHFDQLEVREDRQALADAKAATAAATMTDKAEAQLYKNQSTAAALTARADFADHPDKYDGMTADAYKRMLNDPSKFGSMSFKDQQAVFNRFLDAQNKTAGKLNDRLISDAMDEAKLTDKNARKQLLDPISKSVQTWIDDERKKGTGHVPTESAIRDQISKRLAKGDVTGGGHLFGDANDVYEIQWEIAHGKGGRYNGKPFVSKDGSSAPDASAGQSTQPETVQVRSKKTGQVQQLSTAAAAKYLAAPDKFERVGAPASAPAASSGAGQSDDTNQSVESGPQSVQPPPPPPPSAIDKAKKWLTTPRPIGSPLKDVLK